MNVISIDAGGDFTIGLRTDGTLVGAGDNSFGQLDFDDWTDVVYLSAGGRATVGLKSDGTILIAGDNSWMKLDAGMGKDLTMIVENSLNFIGLGEDGTLLVTGDTAFDKLEAANWTNIGSPFDAEVKTEPTYPYSGESRSFKFMHDGKERQYRLYIPEKYKANMPLVIMLHW